jgi:hypothetical protein
VSSINGGQLAGMRNVLINGAMAIDQRNGGAPQTFAGTSSVYCIDRFYFYSSGASVTGQQVAGPTGFQYAYRITGAAGVTGALFGQRIESANCARLVNQNVTFSANIANSVLTTVYWTAYYANSTNNFSSQTYITSGTFTVSSTATTYSATFNLGANAANGIAIELAIGAQTSGTWTITGLQLELGSVATPFEWRSYGLELSLCQRYFYLMYGTFLATGAWSSSTGCFYSGQFPITMRTTPTLALSAAASSYSTYLVGPATYLSLTGLSLNGVTGAEWWLLTASFASGGQGQGQTTYLNSNGNNLQFSAEL